MRMSITRVSIAVTFAFCAGHAFSATPRTEPVQPIPAVAVTNPAMVELGKKLFFDPRLSKSGFISCNSCHNLSMGGTDNIKTSIGHNWQQGPINSLGVIEPYSSASTEVGRAAVTGKDADRFLFKVPTLRNVELTYPYFHDGEVATLEQAVDIMGRLQLGRVYSEQEIGPAISWAFCLPPYAVRLMPYVSRTAQSA